MFVAHAKIVSKVCLTALFCLWGQAMPAAVGQSTAPTESVVKVSEATLHQIQAELKFLREREFAWQTREQREVSVASNCADSSSADTTCCDIAPCEYACDSCRMSGCDGMIGSCHCSCDSCLCPLPQAACVDCPRVTTLSPYFNVNLFGALKLDMLFNGAGTISPGVPFFLTPDSVRGFDQNTVSIHARQSTLGAAFTGPQFGGFQSGGQVIAMFFNDSVIADQYGFLPLQAFGELRNENWRFAAGLQFDVFSPGIPTVLPFSALAATGNAGNSFRGQLRLERFFNPSNDLQWTLQAALSEPISSTIDPAFRLGEDNGWPNIEGRLALGLGAVQGVGATAKRPFEMGVSGVVGQIRTTPPPPNQRVVVDVWGGSIDLRWSITDRCGVAGEVFTGEGLGTYNAGILQSINGDTLEGIRTTGGWLETFVFWNPCLHSHTGYGIDDPRDGDVADSAVALGRTKNSVIFSNLLWDVNSTFRVGFELTYRETNYKSPVLPDNQGTGFHTQFQWVF